MSLIFSVEALREHMAGNRTDGPLFPGNRSALARRLAGGLQRASSKAGIGRRVYPLLFRRMRIRAYREAGVGEDVIMNALGWTRELGLVRRCGVTPEGTPGDAARVLEGDGSLEERLVEWVMGR